MKKKSEPKENDFFTRVYEIVKKIPAGKVTTYGAIAESCGIKSGARTVGWVLNSAKDLNLPCHRVVNREGLLTGKFHFNNPDLMKDLLISEKINFINTDQVDMKKHFWDPKTIKRNMK